MRLNDLPRKTLRTAWLMLQNGATVKEVRNETHISAGLVKQIRQLPYVPPAPDLAAGQRGLDFQLIQMITHRRKSQ